MKNSIIAAAVFLVLIAALPVPGASQNSEPGITEHLGSKIPLDLKFNDEHGNEITLKEIFNNSTVLAFVYYKCPGICTPLMTEIASVMNKVDLQPGKDYNVITISMDQFENPSDAASKKNDIMKLVKREVPSSSWRFLTGDSLNIAEATQAIGFRFQRKGKQFLHTESLIFVSKDGKICRYLYPSFTKKGAFSILPFDFKMANMETAEGKEIPTMAKIIQFCFSYDPKGKTYVFNLLKVFGAGVLLLAGVFVFYLTVKPKLAKRKTR